MYCASNKTARIKIKNNTHSLRIFVREERRLYAGWVEVRKQRRCSSSRSSEIRRKITEAGFPGVEEVTGFNRDRRCAGRGRVGLTSSAAELPTPSFPIGHLGRAPPSPRLSSTTSTSSTFIHLATFASAVHFCTFPYQLAFLLNIFLHDLLTKLYRFFSPNRMTHKHLGVMSCIEGKVKCQIGLSTMCYLRHGCTCPYMI